MSSTKIATLSLNGKVELDIFHKIVEKSGKDSFSVRRADNGTLLKPMDSIVRTLSEGTLEGIPFVEKKIQERFDGTLVDTNISYAQVKVDVQHLDRTARIVLDFRPDDSGRYLPSVSGSRFLSADGKRGKAAAAPISEDDLF